MISAMDGIISAYSNITFPKFTGQSIIRGIEWSYGHFVHGHQTWTEYLVHMEQDGAWGDHVILCAAAN